MRRSIVEGKIHVENFDIFDTLARPSPGNGLLVREAVPVRSWRVVIGFPSAYSTLRRKSMARSMAIKFIINIAVGELSIHPLGNPKEPYDTLEAPSFAWNWNQPIGEVDCDQLPLGARTSPVRGQDGRGLTLTAHRLKATQHRGQFQGPGSRG